MPGPLQTTLKFADVTTVVGLIRDNNNTVYREEVKHLVDWYKTNNLALNIDKTKEIIVDFRRSQPSDTPHLINHTAVEKVRGTKFQRVPITDTLTWSLPPIQDNAKKRCLGSHHQE